MEIPDDTGEPLLVEHGELLILAIGTNSRTHPQIDLDVEPGDVVHVVWQRGEKMVHRTIRVQAKIIA